MASRILAIGDIHGCDRPLEILLERLDPRADDHVIVLGDVVDRGPDTRGCIDRLLQLRKVCRLTHLMGNHEEMMLDAMGGGRWRDAWLEYGGREALASYGDSFADIPEEHLEFLRSGENCFETESEIFVHGGLDPRQPLDRQDSRLLRWRRLSGGEAPHVSGRRIICGHTAQSDRRPLIQPGWVCIDTAVYTPFGCLTILDVTSETVYQADPSGTFLGEYPLSKFS